MSMPENLLYQAKKLGFDDEVPDADGMTMTKCLPDLDALGGNPRIIFRQFKDSPETYALSAAQNATGRGAVRLTIENLSEADLRGTKLQILTKELISIWARQVTALHAAMRRDQ